MNERGKRQASSIFGGMGFYIALLVCVLAAGVVGYYALLNDNTTPVDDPAGDQPTGGSFTGSDSGQTADWPQAGSSQAVISPKDNSSVPVLSSLDGAGDGAGNAGASDGDAGTHPLGTDAATDVMPGEDAVPTMGQTSIPDEEPAAVTAPLAGETVAVFSIDQLAYNATMGDWRTHDGIDIQAAAGTPVVAAAAGTVRSVEEDGRMGATVVIEHTGGYATTYASLQPEIEVLAGDTVAAGTVIGAVGNTSLTEAGLGAHLHFSVSKDGEPIDPEEFLG